jgi:succinate dehydrogenase hydrophobic anchor subunit
MLPTIKKQENSWVWLIKITFGILIVFLLGIHFYINHLYAPQGLLSYGDVLKYYSNPIIPIMEVIFLIVVLTHSMIGLRGIILDLNPAYKLMKIIDSALISIGGLAMIYGIWLVLDVAIKSSAG